MGLFFFFGGFVVDGAEFQDFEFALAVGSYYRCLVPYLLIKEGASDGAGGRNLSCGYVRFFAGHQLVFDLFPLGVVVDLDGRSETDPIVGDIVHVDHGQFSEALAELADACLHEFLTLLGHVVLGVFAEIAEGGSLLDFLGQLVNQLVFERVDLFLQLSFDSVCHVDLVPSTSGRDYREASDIIRPAFG